LWRGWVSTRTGSSQPHPIGFLSVLQGEDHCTIMERLARWLTTSTGSSQPHPTVFLSILQNEDHFTIVERLAEACYTPAQALLNLIQ
jgi:hypothetical protein